MTPEEQGMIARRMWAELFELRVKLKAARKEHMELAFQCTATYNWLSSHGYLDRDGNMKPEFQDF